MEAPAYLRIAASLRAKIEDGAYPPGSKLPSYDQLVKEPSLVGEESTSDITVRAAYRHLIAEGLVEARSRSGHYVKERG